MVGSGSERGGPCSRCEALPGRIEGEGRLYLWFPLRHTLGHALRVLKGVETPGELDWLRSHGADYVQGYLIAPPAGSIP